MTEPTKGNSPRLHEIVAVVAGLKARTERAKTDAYHAAQRTPQLNGIDRRYQPRDEEGERLPPESTRVQVRARNLIEDFESALERLLDAVAQQEWANTRAFGDIRVGGSVLIAQVPVTYLMWLEKQLIDLRTFIGRLPTLDVADTWTYDADADAYRASATVTTRTKKVLRNHVKAEATDRHPAQVEVFTEDVVVGDWTTTRFSGALPAAMVAGMAARVDAVIDAVRVAREEANLVTAPAQHVAGAVLRYILHSGQDPRAAE